MQVETQAEPRGWLVFLSFVVSPVLIFVGIDYAFDDGPAAQRWLWAGAAMLGVLFDAGALLWWKRRR